MFTNVDRSVWHDHCFSLKPNLNQYSEDPDQLPQNTLLMIPRGVMKMRELSIKVICEKVNFQIYFCNNVRDK